MENGKKTQNSAEISSSEQEETNGPLIFYNDKVIEHFTNPRNVGEMEEGSWSGYSLVGDPECGDQMKLWIKVEKDRIEDIKFKSFGCPGAIATSSMATVLAKGKSLDEAKHLSDDDVVEAFEGIPDHKKHCSMMGVNALHAAIRDYEQKQNCPGK